MALHVSELFERLALPFTDGAVVGDTYYATPVPGSPLRLRISLSPTIRIDEYDGLRLDVVHTEKGVLDTATLTFADHGTFETRDADRRPGQSGYAKILDFRTRPEWTPWPSAHLGALRTAIAQYTRIWFTGDGSASCGKHATSPEAKTAALPQTPPRAGRAR